MRRRRGADPVAVIIIGVAVFAGLHAHPLARPPGGGSHTAHLAHDAHLSRTSAGIGQVPAATSPAAGTSTQGGFVSPLAGGQWAPARTDMGVDYLPQRTEPVLAIGPGTVIYSDTASGWPGGAFLAYRLTGGPAAGRVVYVAEHLTGIAPLGANLAAGQPVATAHPGYPWIETGWASCDGSNPLVTYNGAPDGTPMAGGLEFARLMRQIGAGSLQDPGPGPDMPPACPGGG